MRQEYCVKNEISITYNDDNVSFENLETAEAIVIANDREILINNFDKDQTEYFMNWYSRIYDTIVYFRSLDRLEEIV